MKKCVFGSSKIACDNCARIIKTAVSKMKGVASVSVDVASKKVTVEFDDSALAAGEIADKMKKIGFPAAPEASSK